MAPQCSSQGLRRSRLSHTMAPVIPCGRLVIAFALAAGVNACVPTPAGRITPPAETHGRSPSAAAEGEPGPADSGPTPSPSFIRPTPNPSPTFLVYEVKAGDSLTSIARLFGTTARSIAFWNRARYPSLDPDSSTYAPNRIEVGWTFQVIPTEVVDEDELPDSTPTPGPQLPDPEPAPARHEPGRYGEGMNRSADRGPRIVVTVAVTADKLNPEISRRKNELYVSSVTRQGADPIVLDERASAAERATAFEAMDGLLLSGGSDVDPARYGRGTQGATAVEPGRDVLEAEAWEAAQARGLPVLGICRGFQAINVFSGGSLLQHVDGHIGASWGHGPAATHPLRVAPGTRLARILFPTNARGGVLQVNSYHHQGVLPGDLGRGLVANAWASSPAGDLVEGLEAADGRFVIAVQAHPERTDSMPPPFERLFRVFVDAARGPLRGR